MPVRTSDARRRLGARGEQIAVDYLVGQGYVLQDRNWRCRIGELDLVLRDGEWLVMVEVRTRRAGATGSLPVLGGPEESITRRKLARLALLAEEYLMTHPWPGPFRVDIVALTLGQADAVVEMHHLRDAVGGRP